MKQTQYARILDYLRKHRVATVRDLMRFTNYPSARIFEMECKWIENGFGSGNQDGRVTDTERITRTWVNRNGVKLRLYCLTKA